MYLSGSKLMTKNIYNQILFLMFKISATYLVDLPLNYTKSNPYFGSFSKSTGSKFCFSLMHEIEVFLILHNLDGKKSFGVDKLHPFLASVRAFQIVRPITYIINLSIKQRTFPDNLKFAKVIPIFKQGSRSLCDNYIN